MQRKKSSHKLKLQRIFEKFDRILEESKTTMFWTFVRIAVMFSLMVIYKLISVAFTLK